MHRSSASMDSGTPPKNRDLVSSSAVACSVCLEPVSEDAGDRSIAKLKCGHHFHLDCIGSAFNAKGRMQCPNCRHVEQGQWLYANGCFLHEEFVDDLNLEEDIEAYSGTMNMHFSPTHWCPHQGSYAHLSLTFEELDNLNSGYVEPVINMRVGSRMHAAGGPMCPYLAAHGLSMGVPTPHMDEFLGLHLGHQSHFNRNSRRSGGSHFGHRHYRAQQSAATSSSMPTPYEGSSQNFHRNATFLQPHGVRHRAFGFLIGNPQAHNTGTAHGANFGNNQTAQMFPQPSPYMLNAQAVVGHAHGHPMSRNSYVNSSWTRNNEIHDSHRTAQIPSVDGVWQAPEQVNEYSSASSGQNSNMMVGDGIGWSAATESTPDPWSGGVYAGHPSLGSSNQLWTWVPPGNTHGQRLLPTGVPSNYQQEGQFFGMFPRGRAGFSDQSSEGPYAWVLSGFH